MDDNILSPTACMLCSCSGRKQSVATQHCYLTLGMSKVWLTRLSKHSWSRANTLYTHQYVVLTSASPMLLAKQRRWVYVNNMHYISAQLRQLQWRLLQEPHPHPYKKPCSTSCTSAIVPISSGQSCTMQHINAATHPPPTLNHLPSTRVPQLRSAES